MFRFAQRQGRGLLVLAAVMAIAVSACGGSNATTAPGSSGGNTPGASSGNTGVAPGASGGLGGAAGAFSNLNSYKYSMTLAGGDLGALASAFGGASATGNTPFTITGTVVLKPDKADDITMTGFHIVEIGGFDYMDIGGTGSFAKTTSTTSMADPYTPATIFASAIDASTTGDYNKVGSEVKNGVQTDHYQASAAALAAYGSVLGITDATWTADVWIAQTGGYPASMAVVATAADKTIAYEVLFDITNVNDAGNKVTAPTNVTSM
jgi:hypothetical protein